MVGPGGVGKTSVSAALAIEGARRGRRSAVLTIDPARRLANALGLPEIGSQETLIEDSAFKNAGLDAPKAQLSAMMLDIKQAWDEVIENYHPDPEQKKKLLENRLYHALSTALAGSQEYMAMEKLHRLAHRDYDSLDLIVLDTPPATHALDFLDAPHRIIDALNNEATRWILDPSTPVGGLSRRFFGASGAFLLRTIARFTGTELLDELAELLRAFSGMFEGFVERAQTVTELLAQEDTVFCLVGHPSSQGLQESSAFADQLIRRGVGLGVCIFNRATPDPFVGGTSNAGALNLKVAQSGGSQDLATRLEHNALRFHERSIDEQNRVMDLATIRSNIDIRLVSELSSDVHDLIGLDSLRCSLVSDESQVSLRIPA